jgi:hypothetical protein
MDVLERSTQVHTLLVILNGFTDLIRPSPQHCLEQLNVLIPLIAEAKIDRLSQFVLDALQILQADRQDIHVFVSQFEFSKRLIGDMEEVHADDRDAAEFYTLISRNGITTTDDAMTAYRAVGSLITQLEAIMIKMQENEDVKIKSVRQVAEGIIGHALCNWQRRCHGGVD